MRVFLDANILFSAAKSDGAVRELLRRLLARGHVLCADSYVVTEARRNLELKATEQGLVALDNLLSKIDVAPLRDPRLSADIPATLAEKDRPVLAAAISARCGALVTGDQTHFGALYGKTFDGVTIHSPRSLAAVLLR